jgi:hypothetical protein
MLLYNVYIKVPGDLDWTYLGQTEDMLWDISAITLAYSGVYQWRVDTYDTETELTTTGDTWSFIVEHSPLFPYERKSDYNGDELYQYDSEAWVNPNEYGDTIAFGSGRHRNVLIVVSHGKVYFESA